MKVQLRILMLVGLVVAATGLAQNTSSTGDTPAASPSVTTANDSAQPQAAAPAAPAAEAPAPAAKPAAATPAVVSQPGAVIPLIVMDEVPLTDAIKNLARQAGLNYMLDPKIGFGQVGADGHQAPQPIVSIRWENITAEQALSALLGNYNLQWVEDPKSRIARVTEKDPAALPALVTKVVQLKFAGPSNIVAAVQNTLTDKRSKVVTDNRTSQLVVLATDPELAAVDQLIRSLDTQTKQVLIEARLLETSINPTTTKGVDWTGTLQAQHVSYGNGVMSGSSTTTMPGTPTTTTTTLPGGRQVSTTTTPASSVMTTINSILGGVGGPGMSLNTASGITPNIGFLNADGVNAVLSFLNTYTESKVISAPRTVTLDNTPASIEAGEMIPIINVAAGTANTTGGSSVSYSNVTVRLDVTPRISANNFVNLKVSPKVLRVASQATTVVGGQPFQTTTFATRTLDTSVLIPSGNTLVMGGLIQDIINNSSTKVPLLGDIPGLGILFRTDSKQRTKNNLTIFITPTIVQDEDFQPTVSTYLKTPVPVHDSVGEEWGAWDSGKKKDWSHVQKTPSADGHFDEQIVQPNTLSTTNSAALP